MAKIKKTIIQKPEQLKKARERWVSMQRVINIELQRINPEYKIDNLIRRPDGTVEFEALIEFKMSDRKKVNQVLELLHEPEIKFVRAKYYLPESLRKKVKRFAVDHGYQESSLVSAVLDEFFRGDFDHVA